MKLAHILVCHSVDPTKAIESIPHEDGAKWFVFLHSKNEKISRAVEALMLPRNGKVLPYGTNRGLARSWNEGLFLSMEAGCDAALLLNDDLFFYEGGYNAFKHTIGALKDISRDVGYATPLGLETGVSHHAGQILPQQFACCAIMPECIERIGYFDEHFVPAYYEDVDYDRRVRLAGMLIHVHQAVIVEHERSATQRSMSPTERALSDAAFLRNKAYFEKKWGPGGTFQHPFGDSNNGLSLPFQPGHAD